mgnify:CR=1 FL=1
MRYPTWIGHIKILGYITRSKTSYFISQCLEHRVVRVIWARLSGWIDVGESLDPILDHGAPRFDCAHESIGMCVLTCRLPGSS